MSTLAIIGTAGRGDDYAKLSSDPQRYWNRMIESARKVAELAKADTLVSGGAGWADHCAVALFLSNPSHYHLVLELPAPLEADDYDGLRFRDSGLRGDCGGTANYYHNRFTKALQTFRGATWSSFIDFKIATSHPNCAVRVTPGFKARNLKVAEQANHCLAMTFGEGRKVKDGGTAHTVGAFLAKKTGECFHLDLNTLKGYKNATL